MKIHLPIISAFVLLLCSSALTAWGQTNTSTLNASMQWRFDRLKDEHGNYYPGYGANAVQQANNYRSLSRSGGLGLQWQELGPKNMGGRTRAILIDKRDTTNNTFYAGSVAGGLWKSTDGANTWTHLPGFDTWMAISCITQGPAPDYNIYVGTGVGLDGTYSTGTSFGSSEYGNGIFKVSSTDSAIALTPTVMPANVYNPDSLPGSGSPWFVVNRIVVNPTNGSQVIAATGWGLYTSNNAGVTWQHLILSGSVAWLNSAMFTDVEWTADGNNVYATYLDNYNSGGVIYSTNGGITWGEEGANNVGFPTAPGRIELGITAANAQIIYALVASSSTGGGCTKGLYKSSDAGNSWSTIALGGPQFRLFELDSAGSGCQGSYDMAIAVSPADTNEVYLGGVSFYTTSVISGVHQVGSLYQLNDYHAIVLSDNDPNIMLVSGDYGLYKCNNAFSSFPNPTLTLQNTGYNSILNYGIGAGIDGSVIGGAQNGGTNYISFSGNLAGIATQVFPYDGFLNAVSQVNPNFYYAAHYFGDLVRSSDHASIFSTYFDIKVDPYQQNGATVCGGQEVEADAQFCTPYYMGETFNAVGGNKQVVYTATDRTHHAGEVVPVTSATGNYQFNITLSDSVSFDSSILVDDPIRSRIFMSAYCGVFLTSQPLVTLTIPQWFKLTNLALSGQAESFVSTPDGNNLYVATTNGYVYRFSNLNIHADTCVYPLGTAIGVLYSATDSDVQAINVTGTNGRSIEGIDVDPNDNNHVVVVVAGFSGSSQPHVYESRDGGQTWVADTVGLPNMPCYSIVIHDANTFIMGTEFGIWTWDGSSWHEDDSNLGRVPVYRMIERNLRADGCRVLYVGTHGRGMWRCTTLTPGGCNTFIETEVKTLAPQMETGLKIFPNPTNNSAKVSLTLNEPAPVTIRVFDLTGRVLSEKTYKNAVAGTNLFDLDATCMSSGTYIVAATLADTRTLSKLFVVTK